MWIAAPPAPGPNQSTVRSAQTPQQLIHALRAAVASIDPLLALDQVRTMDDKISLVEAPRRFNTVLITAFAIGALSLTITGIYAVVAFSASLRTQEIAIRMALGARRANIARQVLFSGAKTALFGCALGVIGSLLLSHLVRSFLFDVSATDPADLHKQCPDHDARSPIRVNASSDSRCFHGSHGGSALDLEKNGLDLPPCTADIRQQSEGFGINGTLKLHE